MSNLINTYPVFESSQVLTSSQLNQVVSYLDQQNRLTRVKLAGMGIVCGLELSYDDSGPDTRVAISKGTAVTSEGFLVTLGDCTTSWYRPYELPEGVQYKPFGDPEQDVTLYELLKENPEDEDGTEVKSLSDSSDFLDDKFVLLFLEIFDNDLKSCLGNTCDEQGIDRIFTVRKLLISKEDLDLVLTRSANVGEQYPGKFELADIVMPRTLFDPEADHSRDHTAFSKHYADTFIDSAYTALFGDDSNPGALSETYSVYELLLGSHYDFTNPFETSTAEASKKTWTDFLEGAESPGPEFRGIQYFHDFLKDLILAYDEFRECAFDLMSECSPDMSLFPKHVMIGRSVAPNETTEETSTYRHGFIHPPIYNHQKYLIEKTISLHKRLVLMAENFNLERINNPSTEDEIPLHITPSDEKNTPLSERSIPYYYDSKEETAIAGEGSLEYRWNFDVTRKKLPGTIPLVPGYENQAEDQSAIASPLETPLYYDLDSYPFLRIEGHIGREYQEVVDSINTMKSTFDLPFDLVALQLNPEAGPAELDYRCGFEDLQEDHMVVKSAFCGFARDFKTLAQYIEKHSEKYFDDEKERAEYLDRVQESLGLAVGLCETLPECVEAFDFDEFRQGYKALLQLIIYFNLLDDKLLDNIYTSRTAALYEAFLRIYYGFERRSYYLQREVGLFSSFIQQHPGIEHQAGVCKGGTFILIYRGGDSSEVIADFNLPYLCCGTENCVPMCDEEDSDFEFEVSPLARPDYAITTVNTAVDIHVKMNDDDFFNSELTIDISEEETENGGKIELFPETGVIRYKPGEAFTGLDIFKYLLLNPETDAGDTALVTVLVKEQERREPQTKCYSPKILSCWGIQNVRFMLDLREISVRDGVSGIEALLNDLQTKGAFANSELKSMGAERRRALFDCIAPQHPEMNDTQILESIEAYQQINCGGSGEDSTDDPRIEITNNDITKDEVRVVLEKSRNVDVPSDATREELDNLILNTTHGMRLNRDEVSLFTKDRIMRMLKNREIQFSSSRTKAELINKLFE